jgi:hypothetical protein
MQLLRAIALASLASSAHGHKEYVPLNPNGAGVPGVLAIGHVNVKGGGKTNKYGADFGHVGKAWTQTLCMADSDGDGQTNGLELGDPCW